MNKIIVNNFGGVLLRKEASVRFVSETLERGSEAR